MCDIQDPDLLAHNIHLDNFKGAKKSDIKYYFLTHVHADHIKNLGSQWRQQTHGTIITTPESAKLLSILFPKITGIRPLPFNTKLKLPNGVTVIAAPVRHCIGAAMFIFNVKNKYIMYTGDFRFEHQRTIDHKLLNNFHFDKVYVDDTFANIDTELPSTDKAIQDLTNAISEHKEVSISVRTIGFEQILQVVADKLGIKYRIAHNPKSTTYKLLQYTMKGYIDQKSPISLESPTKDTKAHWICIVCASALCKRSIKTLKNATSITKVTFCQHSGKMELERFLAHLSYNKAILCNHQLTCN